MVKKKQIETKEFCLRDYKNHYNHYWESIGVIVRVNRIFQVLKCSQCEKVILKELEEIE
jgi:hypothetical protein